MNYCGAANIPSYNLAIVGFGNVGKAFLRLLIAKETEIQRRYDVRWRLTGVATRRNGWLADPDGLHPLAILSGRWPAQPHVPPARNVLEWLEHAKPDVFFEAASPQRPTGHPPLAPHHAPPRPGSPPLPVTNRPTTPHPRPLPPPP